jgi:DNA-directed RNA polymerase subunit M/transcription elongation factor TFIIS
MLEQQSADAPYPIACPQCRQIKGLPYDVFMPGSNTPITVYLECETCKHRWSVDRPSPIVLQRDRRMVK